MNNNFKDPRNESHEEFMHHAFGKNWKKYEQQSASSFAELNDIEIFRIGTWNGDTYTGSDLDKIVLNFDKLRNEKSVPLKLGHTENQKFLQKDGLPSAGWVTSVKRVGDKIVASAKDVPQKIYDLIKNGAYKKVSAEIYPSYEDVNGNLYNHVLRAVALLGADVPAVDGLSDVLALYDDGQPYKSYCTGTKMSFLIGGVGSKMIPVSEEKKEPLNSKDAFTVPEQKYNRKFQENYNEIHRFTMKEYGLNFDQATFKICRENS